MIIDAARLRDFVTVIFEAVGSEGAIAREVAEHLVDANLKGHDSHGVGIVPAYVQNRRNGLLHPNARVEVLRDQGAAAGMVSVHFVNVVGHEPQVAPYGGRARCMTTNPFCAVVPRSDAPPLVLDMASSAIALGKVRVAYMKGERIAEGALTDHEGTPTDDPAVMFEAPFGALGPFGGHKGYGLAVICEMLGGALAGAWTAQPEHSRDSSIINEMLMFVLEPKAFGGADGIPIDDQSWAALLKSAEIAGVPAARVAAVAGPGPG